MKKIFKGVFRKGKSEPQPEHLLRASRVERFSASQSLNLTDDTIVPSTAHASPSQTASAPTSMARDIVEQDANNDVNRTPWSVNSRPSSVASSVIKSLSSSHGTINMVGGNQYNAQTIQIFGSSTTHASNLQLSTEAPPAADVFHGRDDYVSQAVSLIETTESTHLAILGAGGIGKTSVSLAVLHHKDIQQTFQTRRYYVSCEAATSPDLLLQHILQVVGVQQQGSFGDPLMSLHKFMSAGPMLLILDNFETPWEESDNQSAVESILQRVAAVEHVSLIVAMRGGESPTGVKWTEPQKMPPLPPISLDAARAAFLEMAGNVRPCQELDTLLEELDCVPLPIKLVAQLAKTSSCPSLLRQWRSQKTTLLTVHGSKSGRLTSIDVSISISLKYAVTKQGEKTTELLGLISHLPDGVFEWESKLGQMLPSFENLEQLVGVLLRTALAYVDNAGTLKVLSPIRHYMLKYHSPRESILKEIEQYYIGLVNRSYNAQDKNTVENMVVEEGNVMSVIKGALKHHPNDDVANAAYNMTCFMSSGKTMPSVDLLVEVMPKLEQLGLGELEAFCLQQMGEIFLMQNKYPEAVANLEMAKEHFTTVGNKLEVAKCLQTLGEILIMQSRYKEAAANVEMAKEQFTAVDDKRGAARCLQCLGEILRMQSRYTEAAATVEVARRQYTAIGDKSGAAQCLRSLGEILRMQSRYAEAATNLEMAKGQFVAIGEKLGATQCLQRLAEILIMQSRYTEAAENLEMAKEQFSAIGDKSGTTQCLRGLGEILIMQSKYAEAAANLEMAQEQYTAIGERLGASQCLRSLGVILMMQSRYTEAAANVEAAKEQFTAIGDKLGVTQCLQSLGEILAGQSKHREAARQFLAAKERYHTLGLEEWANLCGERHDEMLFASLFPGNVL